MKIATIEVELIDHCGSDLSVTNAARVSFHKRANAMSPKDEKLIKYLAEHKHHSPFNHAFMSFRVKAPIFVARQLVKHKFLPWNEVSRRYVDDEPEFYFPDYWRKKADNVKQGSSTEALSKPNYTEGFCKECGVEIPVLKGHRCKEYCSQSCKSKCTNKHRNPYRVVFDNCKARVKREGVWNFELNFDTTEFPEYCPYLGIKLDYSYGKGAIKDNSPSFDRKDSTKGYTKDNVEIISHKANTMKSNASVEDQLEFAKAILLRHRGIAVDESKSPENLCKESLFLYNAMIEDSYCAEQARMVLPQNTMTEWVWSGTLGAFLDMLVLRLDGHTQKETREVAEKIAVFVKNLFPVSYGAYIHE